ncbi:MAG TPA: mechanosensitive ion channel [Burkholderiales bacterium]|nr:mechanosensitive ion channel [Burkholderiales bacterium]
MAIRLIGLLLWIGLTVGPAFAEQGATTPDASPTVEPAAAASKSVAVTLSNRPVFLMHANLLGFTPAERAKRAEEQVAEALAQSGPAVVTTRSTPEGTAIFVDKRLVFLVTPGDVDTLDGQTLDSTVATVVGKLSRAIEETREARDLTRLLMAGVRSLAATALFSLVVWLLARANGWVGARISAAVRARIEKLKVAGVTAVRAEHGLLAAHRLVSVVAWLLGLLALELWLTFVLVQFPYTRPWGEGLGGFVLGTITTMARSALEAVPGLVTVAIIFVLTRFLTRLAHAFFDQFSERQTAWGWLDEDTAGPTRRISVAVLWLFALAMAYPYLPGAHTEAFRGLSVLVGLMISLGASSIVGQAASGLILIYSRALRPGEYVKIGNTHGTVTELGMFATRVETGLGEEVVLPNSFVLSNTTRNYSRATDDESYILDVTTTIGYGTPWRQVHAMLLEAARRTGGVLDQPPAYVIQTALSDFYVEYRLVAHAGPTAPVRRARAMSELHANVQDVFNEHGVQIMSPHYVLDPRSPQVVPPARWYEAPARRPEEAQASGGDRK